MGVLEMRDIDALYVRAECDGQTYPIILSNSKLPGDRQRFSLAHELAHAVLDISSKKVKEKEKFANHFAAALLFPMEIAYEKIGQKRKTLSMFELRQLKNVYGISMQSLILRAFNLAIISSAKKDSLFMQFKAKKWRHLEPGLACRPERPFRLKKMIITSLVEGSITRQQAGKLLRGLHIGKRDGIEVGLQHRGGPK